MEPVNLQSILLGYGPLGVMVIGLGTTVWYLWRELRKEREHASRCKKESYNLLLEAVKEARDREVTLLKETLEHETTVNQRYSELCAGLKHSLEILAERIRDDTRTKGQGNS